MLFAPCGIEDEIVAAAKPLEVFPARVAPVAGIAHLIAMKVLSRDDDRRDQDKRDLRRLIQKATQDELNLGSHLLQQIEDRGFHRGKLLQADFQKAVADFLRL